MCKLFRKKGCLSGKTPEQKIEFFQSLSKFVETDINFFKEQFWDLTPYEREQYHNWVVEENVQKKAILKMVNSIGKILEQRKEDGKTTK